MLLTQHACPLGLLMTADGKSFIKPVIQQDLTGCGLACVATVVGLRYEQVKATALTLGIDVKVPSLWSETTHVRHLLEHFHVIPSKQEIPFRSWKTLPSLALLAIKWHRENGQPHWHWVVYHRSQTGPIVLDPKKGLRHNRRTDFGRIKPKWYIRLRHPKLEK